MAEIQRKVIKQGKRNAVSRLIHARNDKETVAAWKLDLNRILHVFNVCSVTFARSSLTVRFQTELAINTNVVVSDVRKGVYDTQAIVTDIHRTIVANQEGNNGKGRSVSVTLTLFNAESTLTIA